ncbi:MAG: HNH endonuclease [Pseudomonadota bacterium]
MKAVFDTKPTSVYDDDQTEHYQFPRRYLNTVTQCIGDWVVLRRPRADGGNLAYFAVAKIGAVEPDQNDAAMSYARYADFMPFDNPVPWYANDRYAEEALRNIPRAEVGVYLRGRSVRPISGDDFLDLVVSGLARTLSEGGLPSYLLDGAGSILEALAGELPEERERRVQQVLTSRPVRDANFRTLVCDAYDNRCAVTGLRMFDHKGNPEVQGAHIWGVAQGGPDVIQNGIALTATVHWLFDRHLISLSDDYKILVAESRIPSAFWGFFGGLRRQLLLPKREADRPHSGYIGKRRELFFEKNGRN